VSQGLGLSGGVLQRLERVEESGRGVAFFEPLECEAGPEVAPAAEPLAQHCWQEAAIGLDTGDRFDDDALRFLQ